VMFRADGLPTAVVIYKSLLGLNGLAGKPLAEWALPFASAGFYQALVAAIVISLACPTTPAIVRFVPSLPAARLPALASTLASTGLMFGLFVWCVSRLGAHSPFLYFQF
jgi:alginate O-acetyltransferase complex protein AlgI